MIILEFLVKELKFNETDEIFSLHASSEIATIQVPVREILSSNGNEDVVRMVSLLFRNMSGFLPERIQEETGINRSAKKRVMQNLEVFTDAENNIIFVNKYMYSDCYSISSWLKLIILLLYWKYILRAIYT